MTCRSYGLVVDESGTRVLLLRGADGWEIPQCDSDEPRWWEEVTGVNRAFGELVGAELTTLRCLANVGADDRRVRFYELEPHGSLTAGDGAWIDRAELDSIPFAEPEHRPLLVRCLDERGEDGGPYAVPWARPGWFAVAVAWIRDRLGDLGLEPTEVMQERTWSISTVLRASTGKGDLYFKAVPFVFAREPALTRELARLHPGRVPALAAVDEERGWMLMPDFGGAALGWEAPPAALADAAREYAELQLAWVDGGDELVRLGCPDRTLDALEEQIDPLLGETELLLPGHPDGIAPDQLDAVPALAERLHAACDRLRAHALPATLVHGDLHVDNVRVRDGGFLYFDWSDGCLSVPFFDLVPFFEFRPETGLAAEVRERVRDAYLEPWAAKLGRDGLVDAFELAQFVGLFHQAVSYQRIMENTEPRARWEMGTRRSVLRETAATLGAMTFSTLGGAWSWPQRGGSVAWT